MEKAERKKILIEMRELCRKSVDKDNYSELYHKISQGMTDADFRDVDYAKNFEKIKKVKSMSGGVNKENMKNFTFDECRTLFTRAFRGEHWSPGAFPDVVNDKTLFKILERAIEVMP